MKILILLFSLICSVICSAQNTHEANLILFIDEELVIGSITNVTIIDSQGHEREAAYYPGSLVFQKTDFDSISHNDSLMLVFDYSEVIDNKQRVYSYSFSFGKYWLQQQYLVMKIYNLSKKKYKKVFDPLDSQKNYTFELIHPNGQIMRVKKRRKDR